MGHIRIIGGLMPGGRKNMEYLARVIENGRLDVSPLLTHRFEKLDDLEEALLLMKDKPRDLIKPVVTIGLKEETKGDGEEIHAVTNEKTGRESQVQDCGNQGII
jgi:hypothetical protein